MPAAAQAASSSCGRQLLFEEPVGRALVDEELGQARAVLDQRAGVVVAQAAAVVAEIACEGLLAPGHPRRRDDRGEGGGGAEAAGIAQADGQRAVAAHRMADDRLAGHVGGEVLGDEAPAVRPRCSSASGSARSKGGSVASR